MTTPHSTNQLQAIVNRIERLEEDRKTIAADIKEIYSEAKGNGFDVKIIRKVIAKRKKDAAQVAEEESMMDVYEAALGGIDKAPQSYVRPDGVKVTLERADVQSERDAIFANAGFAKPVDDDGDVVYSHTFTLTKEQFDAETGEITERNSGGVDASSPSEGRGTGSDAEQPNPLPAEPISEVSAITSETAEGQGAIIGPSATLSEQDHVVYPDADLEAVDVVSPDRASTADLSEDLAIPDFLVRKMMGAPTQRVFP